MRSASAIRSSDGPALSDRQTNGRMSSVANAQPGQQSLHSFTRAVGFGRQSAHFITGVPKRRNSWPHAALPRYQKMS